MGAVKTIFFSIPSGAHKRAYFQPLLPFLKDCDGWQIICISPLADYPQFIQEGEVRLPAKEETGIFWQKWDPLLFKQYQADLVTASSCGLDDKDVPILQEAKKRNIPALVYIESWDNIWKMERHKEDMVKVDRVLVWNKIMQDHLVQALGYQEEEIRIVGAPRLDPLAKPASLPSKRELYQFMNRIGKEEYKREELDLRRPLIHLAAVELYDNSYLVKIIAQAREQARRNDPESKLAQAQIYCSVHPGGKMKRHIAYVKKWGVDLIKFSFGRHNEIRLEEFKYNPSQAEMKMLCGLFLHSALLVNFSSTAALESMLADTPVINVKFGKPFDWWRWRRSAVVSDFKEHYQDLIQEKGSWVAHNKRELKQGIKTYLDHPDLHQEGRRKTVQKIITFLDGKCSERAFKELFKMVTGWRKLG